MRQRRRCKLSLIKRNRQRTMVEKHQYRDKRGIFLSTSISRFNRHLNGSGDLRKFCICVTPQTFLVHFVCTPPPPSLPTPRSRSCLSLSGNPIIPRSGVVGVRGQCSNDKDLAIVIVHAHSRLLFNPPLPPPPPPPNDCLYNVHRFRLAFCTMMMMMVIGQ